MLLYLLAQEDMPAPDTSMYQIMMVPFLLSLGGVLFFILGMWVERKGKKAPWRWLGVLPILYAGFIGFGLVGKYGDSIYRSYLIQMGEKKLMFSHYGSLAMPVIALIVVACLHFFGHRMKLTPED